ncbi:MAG: hypothetical protein ABW034_04670 [Steroidobacteraceae bacterium]
MRIPTTPLTLGACASLFFVLAWGGIAWGSFQYDDFANILTDPATFNVPDLVERLAHGIRPLTRVSYALSAAVFDEWAGGWLLFNGLLHAITTLGIARLAFVRTGSSSAALAAGLCFALQPANAMVVAYVSGRSTALATTLLIVALLSHERSVASLPSATRWHVGAIVAFACACAAKEIAVVFPLLVLVWEITRSEQSWSIAARRTAPYAVVAVLLCLSLLLWMPRYHELLAFSLELRSPMAAVLHNFAALPATLSLWFTPWALSVEHASPSHWLWSAMGAQLVIGGLFSLRLRTSYPLLTLALLWPLAALAPTHSIIAKLDDVSEGPLYLAWIGPSIAIGTWLSRYAGRRLARGLVFASLLGMTMLCTWRVHVWSDPVLLWREAVAAAPESSRAWTNLGMAQMTAGEPAAARASLRTALGLDPSDPRVMLNLEILAALNPRSEHSSK